jgi:SAM-dependent methyltransferase
MRVLEPKTCLSGTLSVSTLVVVLGGLAVTGCRPPSSGPIESESSSTHATASPGKPPIRGRFRVAELPFDIVAFDTVFWEPRDTASLRKLIHETDLVRDRTVLEIGTGSGLVALCCLHAKARRVVATDVNPNAIDNARYNAEMLRLLDRLETRRVPLGDSSAFAVLQPGERFDLIISNPPWEDQQPESIDEYALYDTGFHLLDSLLSQLEDRLNPGGKALLAYGNVTAIRKAIELAPTHGLRVQVLDDRDVNELSENFLPGMLLEVTPGAASPRS